MWNGQIQPGRQAMNRTQETYPDQRIETGGFVGSCFAVASGLSVRSADYCPWALFSPNWRLSCFAWKSKCRVG
jgi:hypothetical protein